MHRHRRRMAAAPCRQTVLRQQPSLQSRLAGGLQRHVPRPPGQHLRGAPGRRAVLPCVQSHRLAPQAPGAYAVQQLTQLAKPQGLHRRRPDAVFCCRGLPRIVLEHRRFHAAPRHPPQQAADAPAPQQALPRRQHPERHAANDLPCQLRPPSLPDIAVHTPPPTQKALHHGMMQSFFVCMTLTTP